MTKKSIMPKVDPHVPSGPFPYEWAFDDDSSVDAVNVRSWYSEDEAIKMVQGARLIA